MKIEVHDPMIHHPTLEISWENGWQKVRRIAQIAQRTYLFGSVIFMNLFFWVWYFLVFIFLGIPKNAWAELPCHVHVWVHSLGCLSAWNIVAKRETLPNKEFIKLVWRCLTLAYCVSRRETLFHCVLWKCADSHHSLSHSVLGLKKRNSRWWHQKLPLRNQFSRYDPSGKLNPTGLNCYYLSWKLVLTPW